jgi:hypothetical protein
MCRLASDILQEKTAATAKNNWDPSAPQIEASISGAANLIEQFCNSHRIRIAQP